MFYIFLKKLINNKLNKSFKKIYIYNFKKYMGNKEEKNKYKKDNEIELRIELDEYIFFPYGNIKGNIHLKKKKILNMMKKN